MKKVAMVDFGKDHWSLLAYVEVRCVDHAASKGIGELDYRHLRVNEKTHPVMAHTFARTGQPFKPDYGTRLKGYFDPKGGAYNVDRQLPKHDDIDCLDDLEAAGLLTVQSLINGFVQLTALGNRLAAMIREHKTKGGSFASFEPQAVTA